MSTTNDWQLVVRSHRGVESTTTHRTKAAADQAARDAQEDALDFAVSTEVTFIGEPRCMWIDTGGRKCYQVATHGLNTPVDGCIRGCAEHPAERIARARFVTT
jgi:hypothetical protein